jgi:hypothetical protein
MKRLARSRSMPPGLLRLKLDAIKIPFADVVGRVTAESLDEDWGRLHTPRVKNGKPQIHSWEEGLHPQRVSIARGNPKGIDLGRVLDLDQVRQGTPVLWAVGIGGTLQLAPHTLLEGLDAKTGKERRLGHPSLFGGSKQSRIAGELHWDAGTDRFYINNRSGRYSRHEDRGLHQMQKVAEQFAACGLPVEIRLVER